MPARSASRPHARVALRWVLRALACTAALASASATHASGSDRACVAEPPAYRMSDFRAATPCTLAGATVVDTGALVRIVARANAVLIDVLPAPRRPTGLGEGALWFPPTRESLPDSVWLPNTGFGLLPVEEEAYLRENLTRVTAGDPARALVFFCERDCWMSWNAARRAVRWGYTGVYWYPGGTDAWRDDGKGMETVLPVVRGDGQ